MAKQRDFTISRHARQRMSQRGITAEQIQRAIEHPTRVEPDRDDAALTHALRFASRFQGQLSRPQTLKSVRTLAG